MEENIGRIAKRQEEWEFILEDIRPLLDEIESILEEITNLSFHDLYDFSEDIKNEVENLL
jgi:hypothetical protein